MPTRSRCTALVALVASMVIVILAPVIAVLTPAGAAPVVGDTYTGLTPARLLDTRTGPGLGTVDNGFSGIGAVGSGAVLDLTVLGRGGVPTSGVGAVALNVTATEPSAPGFLTVYPTGGARPNASSVNFVAGQTVANMVIAKLGADGQVSIFNYAGSTQVIVDVLGWFPDGAAYTGLTPARLLETRSGPGLATIDGQLSGIGALGSGAALDLPVVGRGGVPASGVGSVALNVTATEPSAPGFLTVYPKGGDRPNASNVNFVAGQTVANMVIAKVSADGFVSIFNFAGTTQVVVDVLGWFPAGNSYTGLTPARLMETRTGPGLGTVDGQFFGTGPIGPGSVANLSVLGRGGVPASGVGAVALNVTATEPTAPSFLTVYPKGGARPNASNVNFVVRQTVANMVVAKVGADGQISIFNFGGSVHVVVDVLGWFPSADVARIDVGSGAVAGVGGDSSTPAISADGRFIAFESTASNLVDADTNNLRDVFVHDVQTNTTTRVDVGPGGVESAGGDSIAPSISADGRYVVFHSSASNLVPNDTNGTFDVFVHDMVTGTTARVSVATNGTEGDKNSTFAKISGNGRFVAFMSSSTNLVADDTNTAFDVFVRDLATSTTTRVSVATGGAQATGDTGSVLPSISFDGRFVAFESTTTNLVALDTNAKSDVFVRDTVSSTTTRVSVGAGGIQENGGATNAAVSDDGRFVGFESDASNLVAGDTNGLLDVFLRDTLTGVTTRVSVSNAENQATGSSFSATISNDGRFVAFHSQASNLVANDINGFADVFVRDLGAGTTTAISVASDGNTAAGGNSLFPALTPDGRYVVYQSDATNLIANDTNGVTDIFIRDLGPH